MNVINHLRGNHAQPVPVQEVVGIPVGGHQSVKADPADPFGYLRHLIGNQNLTKTVEKQRSGSMNETKSSEISNIYIMQGP